MKQVFCVVALLLIVLLTSTVQAQPTTAPAVDYDCDGLVTVADIGAVSSHGGQALNAADLWLYDLDRDGAVTGVDVGIVAALWNRSDLPEPVWCGGLHDD